MVQLLHLRYNHSIGEWRVHREFVFPVDHLYGYHFIALAFCVYSKKSMWCVLGLRELHVERCFLHCGRRSLVLVVDIWI